MQHLDEGTIHAWLDGALDAEEAARAEQHVAACAECAAAVAEARGLSAGATRILAALDNVPAGVIPRATTHRSRSLWNVLHLTPGRAAAAALVFVAAGTALVLRQKPNESRADKGVVFVARATKHAPIVPETSPASKAAFPAAKPPAPRVPVDGNAKVAAAPPEPRVADSVSVAAPSSLTAAAQNRALAAAPAPSPSVADAAKSVVAGVAGAASMASQPAPRAARMKSAMSQVEVTSRVTAMSPVGCYAVEGDSLPMLPRRIVLDTSNAAVAANALQDVATSKFSLAERHAIGAIVGDTVIPVSGWHWSLQRGGVRLEMATPSAAAAQLDSVSASGDLRGAINMNGRQIELFLRHIDCPTKR